MTVLDHCHSYAGNTGAARRGSLEVEKKEERPEEGEGEERGGREERGIRREDPRKSTTRRRDRSLLTCENNAAGDNNVEFPPPSRVIRD